MASRFLTGADIKSDSPDWGTVRVICDPSSTGARHLTILDGVVSPGKGHDFHKHPNQEEILYVVSGRVEQWIDREKRVLGPGEAAFIEAGTVHASFNIGSDEAKVVAIFGPSVGDAGLEMIEMAGEEPWSSLRQRS